MGSYRALISSFVAWIDPGWLYLASGSAIVVASVLIPAQEDLREARRHRDRAVLAADYAAQRVARYSSFLESLEARDPTVMTNLAATQLNLVPASKTPLFMLRSDRPDDANVFREIEPPPPPTPPALEPDAEPERSMLARLVTSGATRPWAVIAGMMCVLVGLLPPARPSASTPAAPDDADDTPDA